MLEKLRLTLTFIVAPLVAIVPLIALKLSPENTANIQLAWMICTATLTVAFLVLARKIQSGEERMSEQEGDSNDKEHPGGSFASFWIVFAGALGVVNSVALVAISAYLLETFGVTFDLDSFQAYSPVVILALLGAVSMGIVLTVSSQTNIAQALLFIASTAVPFLPAYLFTRSSRSTDDLENGGGGEDTRKLSRTAIGSLVAASALFIAAGISLAGSESSIGVQPEPYAGALKAIEGQSIQGEPVPAGAAEAPVGGCVNLKGSRTDPTLKVVSCESGKPGYKIIQRVSTPEQCVSDVDDKYYRNTGSSQWTACLDYAWPTNGCIAVATGSFAQWVDCEDPNAHGAERPSEVLPGETTTQKCPMGGFSHPVRKYTVCTETSGSGVS